MIDKTSAYNISVYTQEELSIDHASVESYLTHIAFVFLIGGLAGWLYEVFIGAPLNGEPIDLGHGGLGIPFLMIYAIGSVSIELVFGLNRKPLPAVIQLLGSTLLATTLEYSSGLIMLHVLQVQAWDYRIPGWDFLTTPDGLICLRASLTFGVMGLLQLRVIDRLYEWLARKNFWVLLVVVWGLIAAVTLVLLNAFLFHAVDVGDIWR